MNKIYRTELPDMLWTGQKTLIFNDTNITKEIVSCDAPQLLRNRRTLTIISLVDRYLSYTKTACKLTEVCLRQLSYY